MSIHDIREAANTTIHEAHVRLLRHHGVSWRNRYAGSFPNEEGLTENYSLGDEAARDAIVSAFLKARKIHDWNDLSIEVENTEDIKERWPYSMSFTVRNSDSVAATTKM